MTKRTAPPIPSGGKGKAAPKSTSDKRAKGQARGKPFTGADDPRRARGGRPKNQNSLTYWFKEFGAMSGVEAAQLCTLYAEQLAQGGDELPLAALASVRFWMNLVSDADPRSIAVAFDRLDGKLAQPISIEPSRVLTEALEKLGLTLEDAAHDPLLANFFALAGVAIDVGAEADGATSGGEAESNE